MTDLWGFLLQTLTVSGIAVMLLVAKALFRDKLPPKWQFGIWGILGICTLLPAGFGGRFVLLNWPMVVDLLKTMTGDYSLTRVRFPVPVLTSIPTTFFEWLFAFYVLGVLISPVRYGFSYLHLRTVIRMGSTLSDEQSAQIRTVASENNLPFCQAVMVKGLPSAFVCGVIHPVLILPEEPVDDKVILHELIHLKNRDTLWSVLICILRSIHWCNPLLVYCAAMAGNDLEHRCDQMVLELLQGEDRRDYGRILLSMTNDRYAKTPGATCISNGGKHIRERIETIARFKLYPAGMELVSLCCGIILLLPLLVGTQASAVSDHGSPSALALSSARTVYCTTPAGAFDCYAKAVMTGKCAYRAMCAPEDMQAQLAAHLNDWDSGLHATPSMGEGYYIYNLNLVEEGYEGMLVFALGAAPDSTKAYTEQIHLATQQLRVERQQGRWVTLELGELQTVSVANSHAINWSCSELPAYRYSAVYGDYLIEVALQPVYDIDNRIYGNEFFGSSVSFDSTPKPHAEFSQVSLSKSRSITHLGTQEQRDEITHIGLGLETVMEGEARPDRTDIYQHQSSSSAETDGSSWCNRTLEPGWGPYLNLYGGGSKYQAEEVPEELPAYFFADLYVNHKYVTSLDLKLQEGGAS